MSALLVITLILKNILIIPDFKMVEEILIIKIIKEKEQTEEKSTKTKQK